VTDPVATRTAEVREIDFISLAKIAKTAQIRLVFFSRESILLPSPQVDLLCDDTVQKRSGSKRALAVSDTHIRTV
jgi:hypothetical protein